MNSDKNKTPLVSIVMSVHNGAKHLSESIDSMLEQTFTDFEFIIIDDASVDSTWEILTEYANKDRRIVLARNDSNLWLAASLDRGLHIARGEYIARQDADDISLPSRLQCQCDFLKGHPEFFLVGAQAIHINGKGANLKCYFVPVQEAELTSTLINENKIYHPSIMFRNDHKHFYREKFRYAQDYDFLLRLLTEGYRLINLQDILIKYRAYDFEPLSQKAIQSALFAAVAKKYYLQRVSFGSDEYDKLDMVHLLNTDIDSIHDASVLHKLIIDTFRADDYGNMRNLIVRYSRKHGWRNHYWMYFFASFLGAWPLSIIRRIVRGIRGFEVDRKLSVKQTFVIL